jgi:hypothetical protein
MDLQLIKVDKINLCDTSIEIHESRRRAGDAVDPEYVKEEVCQSRKNGVNRYSLIIYD